MISRIVPVLLAALLWATAAPADDPDIPEKYLSVEQVKTMLDEQKPLTFVDVRPKQQYDELHIRGARNIPLGELASRLGEVPKSDLVVLY